METKRNLTTGTIKVSAEVMHKIAETAATEIDGVACNGQKLVPVGTAKLGGAVKVRLNGETAAIKLEIAVLEGYNAVAVSEAVQKNVKSSVQNMTGFTVTRVDVNVAEVKLKENKE